VTITPWWEKSELDHPSARVEMQLCDVSIARAAAVKNIFAFE
jgi:hypothetical protein